MSLSPTTIKPVFLPYSTKIEAALELLVTAIGLDPKFQELAKTDSDFDAIRDNPHFQSLIFLE